jgi:hypothetical protein
MPVAVIEATFLIDPTPLIDADSLIDGECGISRRPQIDAVVHDRRSRT